MEKINSSKNVMEENDRGRGQPNEEAGNLHIETENDDLRLDDDEVFINMTHEAVMDMEFETLEEAENFYKKYAKVNGFGVRLDDVYRNKHGELQSRKFVCSAEGKRSLKYIENPERKREHKAITRTGCKAGLRVRRDKESGRWRVYQFEGFHNHDTLGPKHSALHRCHRKMTTADIAQIDSMCSYGIKGSQIYGYIAGQSGGYDKPGFTKKDMYNHINRVRNSQTMNGDAMAALHYLKGNADSDPMFFMKYSCDNEGRLQHLFWVDGLSKVDYQCFGDVLAFDTTYKKNKYNCPIVIFSGVNHHKNTVVFGCAIVADETEETYKWVLMALLEAMNGKEPISVITDSDKAMKNAIKCVLPQSCHRLCAWHLQRNATSNVADPNFTKAFTSCLFADVDIPEFELKWRCMVEEFGVQENKWVQKMYKKRAMWAAAYLRGKLFVGLRTTSQCEGMNAYISRFVKQSHNLVEFLHHFQRGLSYFRYNELVADFKTYHGEPVLVTALESIERSGAEVYTREAFWIFQKAIKLAITCVVADCKQIITTRSYKVKRFLNPNNSWDVHIDKQNQIRIACECGKFQSFGIPCHHIIFVMIQEGIDKLPPCCIARRWTKYAKEVDNQPSGNEENSDKLAALRFGSLLQDCRLLCNLASRSKDDFLSIREKLRGFIKELEDHHGNTFKNKAVAGEKVLNPCMVKSKGRPPATSSSGKKRKRCSICHVEGHTKVTCARIKKNNESGVNMLDNSKKESQPEHFSENYMCSRDKLNTTSVKCEDVFMDAIMGEEGAIDFRSDIWGHFTALESHVYEEQDEDEAGIWTLDGRIGEDGENDENTN